MMDLLLIIVFSVLGVLVGVVSGLLPGLHVNNIALILLSVSGSIVALCTPLSSFGISEQFIVVLICVFITSVSISHSFHDAIPTTFLGAPEEDTALSVLPAHRLLLQGRGYEAVVFSAIGSLGAIVVCFLLLYPLRFLVGEPLNIYAQLQEIMFWVLIAISILMLATEKGKITDFGGTKKTQHLIGIGFATFVFFLSGIFGLVILNFPLSSPIGLPATVLFPSLAGLFGMPTLVTSLFTKPIIPQQTLDTPMIKGKIQRASLISIISGSLSGMFVSLIPGISSSTGTVIAMNTRKETDNEQTIVTLSAVNASSAFAVIILLYIILKTRSGVTVAINELIPAEEWTSLLIPTNLIYLLIAVLFSAVISFFLCLRIAKIAAQHFTAIPYGALVMFTIGLISTLVILFTGILGIVILLIATCIGLLPVLWGVRRSHCMGVLLIPVILYFL